MLSVEELRQRKHQLELAIAQLNRCLSMKRRWKLRMC